MADNLWSDELPRDAQELVSHYEKVTEEIRKKTDRRVRKIRRAADAKISQIEQEADEGLQAQALELAGKIKPLQEEYVRAGKLDEALAIRDKLRSLRTGTREVRPDPGVLYVEENDYGKAFVYDVVGNTQGPIWGTDIYTSDSRLATVAVHAGILQPSQKGLVKVTVLDRDEPQFEGSTRNGVTSTAWNGHYPAFRVSRA
jgi:hypothetical protein